MRTFKGLISVDEALRAIAEHIRPVEEAETVGLLEARGRVLSEEIIAGFDVPQGDRSAMDGYAVRAGDTVGASASNPARLKRIGSVVVGQIPAVRVHVGECASISTGCFMPEGADAVVMHENTELTGDIVAVYRPAYSGENISAKGSDVKKGSAPLNRGDVLTPARIGVLASLGRAEVNVLRKPRIAIVPTGAEVKKVGSSIGEAEVYDINSHTLAAVVQENGCVPIVSDVIPDERNRLLKAIGESRECDLIVIAGGSSVGERDLMYEVLSELGQVLFHGVQIRPGKPTICAVVDGKIVLGMPGHPTSCLSNAYIFLMPVTRKLAGLPERNLTIVKAKLSRRIVSTLGRKVFMTVRIRDGEAEPVFKESSAITSMAGADGYIVIPENVDTLEKGDEVEVLLFY
ncbi:MAG TPA: gephyrin-like molybdotransferase Glp [Thermoproteota archaeon]|nr:gephyrin-like molybdotransferase Glp [Thermoproteota archaeon]